MKKIDLNYLKFPQTTTSAPTHLVVFLHGYGSNATDLITLAPELQPYLPPNTVFISAEAPFHCEANIHNGYQWFSLANLDEEELLKGARNAASALDEFIAAITKQLAIPAQNTAVIGFSQGAMMALHTAFRRPQAWAAVLGYSGKLIAPKTLAAEIICKPLVGLIHGSEDAVVPAACMLEARNALLDLQVDVETCLCPQLGHGIDYKGIKFGGEFLRKAFGSFSQ